MSWYFFGGFSAYAMEPSARLENHSGCSVTHGWSGEACSAKSSATSSPRDLRLGHEPVEGVEVAEVGMDGVVAALDAADRPRRAGIARARGSSVLFAPLRNEVPIGWIGGR